MPSFKFVVDGLDDGSLVEHEPADDSCQGAIRAAPELGNQLNAVQEQLSELVSADVTLVSLGGGEAVRLDEPVINLTEAVRHTENFRNFVLDDHRSGRFVCMLFIYNTRKRRYSPNGQLIISKNNFIELTLILYLCICMKKERNINMLSRNTFGMDVAANCLVEYDSVAELAAIFRARPDFPQPFFHLGGGSNILFTGDFAGTILHSNIKFIEEDPVWEKEDGTVIARVGAGVVWDDFCAWCSGRGLWGPENLSSIPGEVGASAVQNIGAYGREVKDFINEVECFDTVGLEPVVFSVKDCQYAYRDSFFKKEGKGRFVITAVCFRLSKCYSPELDYGHVCEAAVREYGREAVDNKTLTPDMMRRLIMKIRKEKLPEPAQAGSAGSFFRNPFITEETSSHVAEVAEKERLGPVPRFKQGELVKIPAAWFIDKCGWKGYRDGNVGVWDHQPLVLVNATGKASPKEVIALENRIIESVRERFGVELDPEVEHV